MTISNKHKFTSPKGDGLDTTQVQPSNWNDEHALTMASGNVMGRMSAGTGAVEELAASAFGLSVLDAADAAALQTLIGPQANIADFAITYRKLQIASAAARILASNITPALTITGAANNGTGLIRLTVSGTTVGFTTGQKKAVYGVVGTTEANGVWTITVIDTTHIDLQGSAFAHTYISGGTIGAGYEEHTISDLLDFFGSVARGDIAVRGASVWNRLAIGTAGQVLTTDGIDTKWGNIPLLHVREEQPQGTISSTSATSGSWVQRTINVVKANDISGASLNSNNITLPAGTYEIDADVPIDMNGTTETITSQSRLRDVTNNVAVLLGMSMIQNEGASAGVVTNSWAMNSRLKGRFILTATTVVSIEHFISKNSGRPRAANITTEVYLDAMIRKIG